MRREWNLLVRAPARPWIGRLLKKRDGKRPFFVNWVENAEQL
jgi:hypothetical protein